MAERGIVDADTIWELLAARAARSPHGPAVVDQRGARLSFGELCARAERVAAGLLEQGVTAGTVVAWQLPSCVDALLVSLALARLGAVQVPMISLYREREVGYLLDATGAELFVTPRVWRGFDYEAMAVSLVERGLRCRVLVADDGLPDGDPSSLPPPPADPEEIRWLYSTSGTTSNPKIVCHADAALLAGGVAFAKAIAPEAGDVATLAFPLAHIGGADQLVMTLRCGVPQVFIEVFMPDDVLPLLRAEQVTMFGGGTAHYQMLLDAQVAAGDVAILPTLRMMLGGGAPKPPAYYWRVKNELGARIFHGYGMTECPLVAMATASCSDEQHAETDGVPIDACEVRIADPSGGMAEPGADGEIEIRGPALFRGYLDPALTSDAFTADGWFRTGDRGRLRVDGHLVVTGRTKELIIRKGENLSPVEIEAVLAAHPKVAGVAVIGLPDVSRGERACAVIELSSDGDALTFEEMQQWCREAGLMTQKIPEQLEVVAALPRNSTAKVLKHELVARFGSREYA